MNNIDNMYLKKKPLALESTESLEDFFLYTKIEEINGFVIIRKESTIDEDDNDIVSMPKGKFSKDYYPLKDFFKNAYFIGSSGYYDYPGNEIDRYLYKDWVVLYRDNDNEFIYDSILEKFFIKHIYHELEDFVPIKTDIEVPNIDIKRYIR